jgi:hypothetical protein
VSEEIVNALLEGDEKPLDPKYFAARVPTVYDDAIEDAKDRFMAAYNDGSIADQRRADELANEIVQEICDENDWDDNDDFEEVSTPLFKLAAELFPGNW